MHWRKLVSTLKIRIIKHNNVQHSDSWKTCTDLQWAMLSCNHSKCRSAQRRTQWCKLQFPSNTLITVLIFQSIVTCVYYVYVKMYQYGTRTEGVVHRSKMLDQLMSLKRDNPIFLKYSLRAHFMVNPGLRLLASQRPRTNTLIELIHKVPFEAVQP